MCPINSGKISVIIATYNGSRTIEETLDSCLAQSEPPAEVIVVDDASTDNTVALVQSLTPAAVPVRVIRHRHNSGGPARPFNTGIAHACGDLIALLEQDDLWHRDKLALSRKAFEMLPEAGMAYAEFRAFEKDSPLLSAESADTETLPQLVSRDEAVKRAMERQFTLTLSNMVFTRSCWGKAGGFPEQFKICTDYAFLSRLLSAGCRIASIPQPLVYYRVRPVSHWFSSDFVNRNFEKCSVVDSLWRAYPELMDPRIRRKLGLEIFDTAIQSAGRGKIFRAAYFYFWSLRHKVSPFRVFRVIGKTLMKLLYREIT